MLVHLIKLYPDYKKYNCTAQVEMLSWIPHMPFLYHFSKEVPDSILALSIKKHSTATARVVYKHKVCDKKIHSFYLFREQKWNEHGRQRGSGDQNIDVTQILGDVDDKSSDKKRLKEELETCKHFLVESEM